MITILTDEAKRLLVKNKRLRMAFMELWTVCSRNTFLTWIKRNDPHLTNVDTLRLIEKYTDISQSELTTQIERTL